MTSPVLVTGGTGRLGRSVVARLVDVGCEVRVLARRERGTQPQVTFFIGDLRRGEGIDPAVRGAGAIIHCATATKGDAEATRNLAAAARAGSPHFVQPSIVGIDAMAAWGYVKAKLEVERIVENGGLPWTILRVTQFYSYCAGNSRKLAKFPLVAPVPGGFRVQPADSREVAARLVELALGAPAGRAPDMSGPEVSSWEDLSGSYLAATHQRKWVVPMPVPGSRAARNGALLPPPGHTEGTRTWDQFLAQELPEHRGDPDPASRVTGAWKLAQRTLTACPHHLDHPRTNDLDSRRSTLMQQLAALVLWIATVNVFNRVNIATRQIPGEWAHQRPA